MGGGHSQIDFLIGLNDVQNKIQNINFGKEGQGFLRNNLINALVESQVNPNQDFEDILRLDIGGRFGKDKSWGAKLFRDKSTIRGEGKDQYPQIGFDIARLF
jgi:hypothetical protein